MAVANYDSAYGRLPPAVVQDSDGNPMHSWRVLVLPYMERQDLYDQYDFSVPWDHPTNARLAEQVPHLYRFPGRTTGVETNYLAVVGPGSAFDSPEIRHASILQGAIGTLMIVENVDRKIHWMQPSDISIDDAAIGTGQPGGLTSIYVQPAGVTVDGQVIRLEALLSQDGLRALMTIPAPHAEPSSSPQGAIKIEDGRLRELR